MWMSPNRAAALRSRPAALAIAAVLVLAVLVCLVVVRGCVTGEGATGEEHSVVIQSRPFEATLGVAGIVVPGEMVGITAPFDGKVSRVTFDYGTPVVQGQALIVLDTSDIERRRNEAEADYLKASETASEMASWSTGLEVSQARRAAAAAEFDLNETRRKAAETRKLLDKGLVARDEYDGLVELQRNQQLARDAALQELAEALKKGDAANQRISAIELQDAKARLDELDAERARAVVRAPIGGVIVRPPGEKNDAALPTVHPGMNLATGQLIGEIASPNGLAVVFQLAEADANRVRPGQHVEVTGPGFQGLVLDGTVADVAGEATPAPGGEGSAVTFAASVRLHPLTAAQAAVVRIGMSATLSIDLYRNPDAVVAPPGAIQGTVPDTFVMVRDAGSGRTRRVPIRIGQVAPDGVEVLSGLKPGDVVVWTASASADGGGG